MRRSFVLAVAVATALTLSACGSDDDEGTPAASSPSPSAAGDAPSDPAKAEAEVRAAWEGFFDGSKPAAPKAALIEQAAVLAPALELAAKDPNASKTSAKVTAVTFASATEANVTYDLSSAGTVVLPGAQGKAVVEGGAWKVSKQTFCQLAALRAAGAAVPGCS